MSADFLTDFDRHLFSEGKHYASYEKLGAHLVEVKGQAGVHFAVWAPDAESVSVVGDFNGWTPQRHLLHGSSQGIWSGFVAGVGKGAVYKYHIVSRYDGYQVDKADPYAFRSEVAPKTASVVWELDYSWNDQTWMRERAGRHRLDAPIAIYELHIGSWRRVPEDGNRSLSYRELAPQLIEYVQDAGFTHVQFMPVMEHPFFGSWGYQITGFFTPSSRYGTPQDFMALVDALHQAGIGVILDWVPSHFPSDEHGLAYFDGTHLYEHADRRVGFHPEWNSYIFNYGRNEVCNFLISSALLWLDHYHADGLRVDGVASMLYLDYARKEGEWIPNRYGGKENLAAIGFLRRLNEEIYLQHPDVVTIAEESTSWPMVSRPTYVGGLGFGLKWDMGWMHDTLEYMKLDPVHRKYHHNNLTFRMLYAFSENFVLPLSHDEVVYGKASILGRMAGDDWQKFANARLLYGYMYTQPGKKLLFMGGEFGQWSEWNHDSSLEWHLLQYAPHQGLRRWVRDLNTFYRGEPSAHALDCDSSGFEWIDCNDADQSVLSFARWGYVRNEAVIVACNFTPVPRASYRIGVPWGGWWRELLNSDAPLYGGSGMGNAGGVTAMNESLHGRSHTLDIILPPLAIVVFKGSA